MNLNSIRAAFTCERLFRLVLGLGFLPDRMRRWIFGTGTRALEVFNALALVGWSVTMLLDDRLLQTPTYLAFNRISDSSWLNEGISIAFAVPAVVSVAGIYWNGVKLKMLAGISLLGSALAWALVTAGFIASYPPTNTAVTLYAALSMLCFFAGEHLIFESEVRKEELESAPAPLNDA